MPVPSSIVDLSTTFSSNSPAGTDLIGNTLDEYLRAISGIIKQNASVGSDITSATTITPPASGYYFNVIGTATITTIASTNSWNGRLIVLEFAAALTLTHNASTLILHGGANITTAAGDVAFFVQESSGSWRCISYQYASGQVITGGLTISNDTSGNVYGESFTHVITNGTNVASSAFVSATYSRIASIVTGVIRMTIDTTAAGAFTLELSIPVASNFATVSDAIGNGVANISNATPDHGAISSSVANDRLILSGYAHGSGNETWFINYQYKII